MTSDRFELTSSYAIAQFTITMADNMSNHLDFTPQGYQIERELGQNSAGGRITYLATDTKTQTPVIIKQFQFAHSGASWADYDAYDREIKVLRHINHPNIPLYLDSFETATGFCLVQEYKQAPSLEEENNFTPEEIKQIAIGVLEILVYLQNQNPPVIHRDIKPENILVERHNNLKVYLVDFGFARQENEAVSSVTKGTLGFMPPEQLFKHPLSKASDLYSLGATLICLLTGTKSDNIGSLIDDTYHFNLQPLTSKLTSQFINWLQKMVAPKVKDRFQNAEVAQTSLKSIAVVPDSNLFSKIIHLFPPKVLPPILAVSTISIAASLLATTPWQKPANNVSNLNTEVSYQQQTISNNNAVSWLLETGECPDCDLRGVELQGVGLQGANLYLANFGYANLKGAYLQGANLKMANFESASLQAANLQGADSERANFERANLDGANLQGANFKYAELGEAFLQGANLDGTILQAANLSGARLRGASLQDANLQNTNLNYAFGDGVNFQGANLQGADLKNSSLENTNLSGANLSGANLSGANLSGANLKDVDLWGANLTGANLIGAILPDGYH